MGMPAKERKNWIKCSSKTFVGEEIKIQSPTLAISYINIWKEMINPYLMEFD